MALLLISPSCHINSRHASTSRPAKAVDEDFLVTTMLDEYARLCTRATTPLSLLFRLQFYIAAFKGLFRQLLDPPYISKWITRAKIPVLESRSDPKDSPIHLNQLTAIHLPCLIIQTG